MLVANNAYQNKILAFSFFAMFIDKKCLEKIKLTVKYFWKREKALVYPKKGYASFKIRGRIDVVWTLAWNQEMFLF